MELEAVGNGYAPLGVFQEGAALGRRSIGGHIGRIQVVEVVHIQARLGTRWIYIVRGQQAMSLRPHISDLQHHVSCKLTLNREVVLRRVLRTQVRFEFTVEEKRAKQRVIHGLAGCRSKNAVERVRRGRSSGLVDEGSVEERVEQRRTAPERRFSTELR